MKYFYSSSALVLKISAKFDSVPKISWANVCISVIPTSMLRAFLSFLYIFSVSSSITWSNCGGNDSTVGCRNCGRNRVLFFCNKNCPFLSSLYQHPNTKTIINLFHNITQCFTHFQLLSNASVGILDCIKLFRYWYISCCNTSSIILRSKSTEFCFRRTGVCVASLGWKSIQGNLSIMCLSFKASIMAWVVSVSCGTSLICSYYQSNELLI